MNIYAKIFKQITFRMYENIESLIKSVPRTQGWFTLVNSSMYTNTLK